MLKKMISILITMDQKREVNISHDEATKRFIQSVNEMHKSVKEVSKALNNSGYVLSTDMKKFETNKKIQETKTFSIQVVDEHEKARVARVKCFPILEDESPEEFSRVNKRIDMILDCTDTAGNLTLELPLNMTTGFDKGHLEEKQIIAYMIEVQMGSEYTIEKNIVDIRKSDTLKVVLKQLIDLKEIGWYAGDLHHHSIFSSPVYGGDDPVVESPAEVKAHMTSIGLSFGALSDHHNVLNHEQWMATKDSDFLPIVSKEISTTNGHVMSLNVQDDVIYKIPKSDMRTHEYLHQEFIRITDQIRDKEGLAQINHPRDMNPSISLSSKMSEHINMFDTMEIWNGSIPMMPGTTNDQAFKLWLEQINKGEFIPGTTGSDTHNTKANDYNQLFDQLQWLFYQMDKGFTDPKVLNQISKEDLEAAKSLMKAFQKSASLYEKWAEENLGSGGVRTYVHLEPNRLPETKKVLESLKKGQSFLTNGPIILADIKGKTYGERLEYDYKEESLIVNIKLIANKKLSNLMLMSKNKIIQNIDLLEDSQEENVKISHLENKLVEVQTSIDTRSIEDNDCLICKVYSDPTNLAITNPIFLNKN